MKFLYFLVLTLLSTTVYATNPVIVQPQTVVQQPVVVQRHITEFDSQTYLGLQGYYGTQDKQKVELAQQHSLDRQALRDLAQAVLKAVDKINGGGQSNSGGIQPPTVEQPTVVESPQQPKPLTGTDLDKKVYEIFKRSCASCHSDASNSGGLKLVSSNGLYDLSAKQRFNVHFRTFGVNLKTFNKNLMPLNNKALADDEVSILYDWAVSKLLQELKQ